ncbi:MAG: hypothetical protein RMJ96_03035 [Candidatus Bipolaricaulota bacterium]|nr:hypothetical protein [Candidatus Bipolaricaulota bacterium]
MAKRAMKAKAPKLDEGLERSLAEQRAGQLFGPFDNAQDAMEFLYAAQDLLVFMEKALRQAATLGKRYDPKKIRWLLDVPDRKLARKLKRLTL